MGPGGANVNPLQHLREARQHNDAYGGLEVYQPDPNVRTPLKRSQRQKNRLRYERLAKSGGQENLIMKLHDLSLLAESGNLPNSAKNKIRDEFEDVLTSLAKYNAAAAREITKQGSLAPLKRLWYERAQFFAKGNMGRSLTSRALQASANTAMRQGDWVSAVLHLKAAGQAGNKKLQKALGASMEQASNWKQYGEILPHKVAASGGGLGDSAFERLWSGKDTEDFDGGRTPPDKEISNRGRPVKQSVRGAGVDDFRRPNRAADFVKGQGSDHERQVTRLMGDMRKRSLSVGLQDPDWDDIMRDQKKYRIVLKAAKKAARTGRPIRAKGPKGRAVGAVLNVLLGLD